MKNMKTANELLEIFGVFVVLILPSHCDTDIFIQECNTTAGKPGYICPQRKNLCIDIRDVCGIPVYCRFSEKFCTSPYWDNVGCKNANFTRCSGWRKGQCIHNDLVCNELFECVDRSDESHCRQSVFLEGQTEILPLPLDFNKNTWQKRVMNHSNELCRNTQLQIGKVKYLQESITECLTEDGNRGLTLAGPKVECFQNVHMCDLEYDYAASASFSDAYYDCPPLMRYLKSNYFCKNATKFEDFCSKEKNETNCKGNSPSKCFTERDCFWQKRCPDKSDYSCKRHNETIDEKIIFFASCVKEGFICKNKKQCIHIDLLCDGHVQCEDESDEGDEQCGSCPINYYGRQGRYSQQRMWYSCKHRYTDMPICAIPCDHKDDLCYNEADEQYCQSEGTSYSIIISLLVGLMIIGCVLGEIIYRLDFQCSQLMTQEEAEYDEVSQLNKFLEQMMEKDHENSAKLRDSFQKIHCENMVANLIVLSDLQFKSYQLVRTFKEIYQLELSIHGDNIIDTEICLKESLGTNEVAGKFLDYVELGFFTRQKLKIANNIQLLISRLRLELNMEILPFLLNGITFTMNIMLYYLDLVKDILFVIFMRNITKGTYYNVNEEVIVNTLISIICINEGYKLLITLSMKRGLQISSKGMLLMVIAFPFLPAILFYIIAKLSHERNSTENLNVVNAINFNIWEIRKYIARMKRSENALENLLQLILIILLIGVSLSPTTPLIRIKSLSFIDTENVILYFAALLSILTIIRASLQQLKASFNGFLTIKGAVLYGIFLSISVAARILASVIYFSPNWGLLPILWHWKIGQLGYHRIIGQIEHTEGDLSIYEDSLGKEKVGEIWNNVKDYDYIWIERSLFPLIFLSLYFMQIFISFVIRMIMHKKDSKIDALGHALDNVISPSKGGILNIITFTFGNMVLMIPLWVLAYIIMRANKDLDDKLPQVDEELYSTHFVYTLTISGTIVLGVITPLLQFWSFELYKKYGQPWYRIENMPKDFFEKFFSQLRGRFCRHDFNKMERSSKAAAGQP